MIRRSPIRRKKKTRRVAFNSGVVREDSAGMARLRSAAFHRSGGHCECYRVVDEFPPRSDVLDRVSFINRRCHEIITGELQWSFTKREAQR